MEARRCVMDSGLRMKIEHAHRTHAHACRNCDGSAIGDDVVVGDDGINGTHGVLRCGFAQCEK